METKDFHLSDILSVTTGRLVSTRHVDGLYDLMGFMTGESLFTHQLSRASDVCAPALLEQHPQLKDVDASKVGPDNWKPWLDNQIATYGEMLTVTKLQAGAYETKDPITEAAKMIDDPHTKVIVAQI